MPRFLIKGNYTAEGMNGLKKDKASGREKAVAAACEAQGGKLEALYFALGEDDVFVVVDMPSHVQAAALCVAVGASGMLSTRTVPLLTVAEMDPGQRRHGIRCLDQAPPPPHCPSDRRSAGARPSPGASVSRTNSG
jgi:uncharacterized protein with GYD domain